MDVNYQNLVNYIKVGDTVLVDNGLLRLEVLAKDEAHIRCRVLIPGPLSSRRHINLPGVKVNLPAFTEKDRGDTAVGIEEGVDFVALSFVREAADVEQLRAFLKEHKSSAKIIASLIGSTLGSFSNWRLRRIPALRHGCDPITAINSYFTIPRCTNTMPSENAKTKNSRCPSTHLHSAHVILCSCFVKGERRTRRSPA